MLACPVMNKEAGTVTVALNSLIIPFRVSLAGEVSIVIHDPGREFTNADLRAFGEVSGVKFQVTAARSKQENSLVERVIGTIADQKAILSLESRASLFHYSHQSLLIRVNVCVWLVN